MNNFCVKSEGGKYLCLANVSQERTCVGFMEGDNKIWCLFKICEELIRCQSMKAIKLLEKSFTIRG